MKIKSLKTVIAAFLLGIACGCMYVSGPGSINSSTEVLEEGSFRFRYPVDWKITTEEKMTDNGEKIATYYFRHPQARECLITVEWIKYSSGGRQADRTNEIIAEKTRNLKKTFRGSGFGDFSLSTSDVTFAKHGAVKATFQGQRSSLARETIMRIVSYKGDYYAVSYQAYSNWKAGILSRLEEITQSFEFVR